MFIQNVCCFTVSISNLKFILFVSKLHNILYVTFIADKSSIKDMSYIVYENVTTQLTCTAIGGYPYPEISIAFGSINARTPPVITMLYHVCHNILHIGV